MFHKLTVVGALLAIACSGCPETRANSNAAATDGGERGQAGQGSAADAASDGAQVAALSAAERAALRYMREEEKLARDVYLLNAESLRIFANISASEAQHMSAVLAVLDRYGIADPVGDNPAGVFVDAELQSLYATLAQRAGTSLTEALRVGAEIEEIDIVDLQEALADVTHDDVAVVYDNLMRGSRNHLRAFTSNLATRGVTYVPKHLSAESYAEIVGTATETGSGRGAP